MSWASDPGYWLARLVFTRGIALVYLLAFACALLQFRALIGEQGLLPVPRFVARSTFRRSPSLFHLRYSDRLFGTCCWAGLLLSAAGLAGGLDLLPVWAWMAAWLALWCLYLSVVNVGQIWYSFGWESLLLEAGFLTVLIGPASVAPPTLVMWMLRWMLFRLEFGAGLIKLRGDRCWRDLTCLRYHHETQPLPNPLSWYFHHLGPRLHKVEVLANHLTQLVVVFALFTPQPYASIAALVIAVTQAWLVLSGNFSWLNLLTMVSALSVVDDRILHALLPIGAPMLVADPQWYAALVIALAAGVVVLSYWPVRNMLSGQQRMNASFNPLHLVNTYGAFGRITRERREVVLEGTSDLHPGPETVWKEYEFKGKPGDLRRRPPQVAPYHLRLDWMMWFAGISSSYAQSWMMPLVFKLLQNDARTIKLLRSSPFGDRPPTFVRARVYRYRFTTREERRHCGAWWDRILLGELVRPVSLEAARSPNP